MTTEYPDEFAAAQQVLNTYELVANIVAFLDKSLVHVARVQRINRTFRNVVTENSALQKQFGFRGDETVLNVANMRGANEREWSGCDHEDADENEEEDDEEEDEEDDADSWSTIPNNPLLEWFNLETFNPRVKAQTASKCWFDSIKAFHLLARACKAAREPTSAIHRMSLTRPPVNSILLLADDTGDRRSWETTHVYQIDKADGVTIGDLLLAWLEMDFQHAATEVYLHMYVPWSDDSESSGEVMAPSYRKISKIRQPAAPVDSDVESDG